MSIKVLFLEQNCWYSSLPFTKLYKCRIFSVGKFMSNHEVGTNADCFSVVCSVGFEFSKRKICSKNWTVIGQRRLDFNG